MIRQRPPTKQLNDRKYLVSIAKLSGIRRGFGKKTNNDQIHRMICKKLRPRIQEWLTALDNNLFEPQINYELLLFYADNENCIAVRSQ